MLHIRRVSWWRPICSTWLDWSTSTLRILIGRHYPGIARIFLLLVHLGGPPLAKSLFAEDLLVHPVCCWLPGALNRDATIVETISKETAMGTSRGNCQVCICFLKRGAYTLSWFVNILKLFNEPEIFDGYTNRILLVYINIEVFLIYWDVYTL